MKSLPVWRLLVLCLLGSVMVSCRTAPSASDPARGRAFRRVLFLGNSITQHGPKADIGWTGSWGMAASSEDKDYVHLVQADLARRTGVRPEIRVHNIAAFERAYATCDVDALLREDLAFDPDLVILAIGENVPALGTAADRAGFKAGVLRILAARRGAKAPRWVVRSSFWADAAKDEVLREACLAAGGVFVDIGALGRDPAHAARSERSFSHEGVAAHPGDRGMRAIADALVAAILR